MWASRGGEEHRRRAAAQMQVLAQEVGEVGPPHGLREPQDRSLSLRQLRRLAAIAAAMVVVMMNMRLAIFLNTIKITIMMVETMMIMMMFAGATEVGETPATGIEGLEPYGRESPSSAELEGDRPGGGERVDSDAKPPTREERFELSDSDRVSYGLHWRELGLGFRSSEKSQSIIREKCEALSLS